MAGLLLLIALALAHEGPHDALLRADALVAMEPDVAAHRVLRADLYRRDGQPERALEDAAVAIALDGSREAWLITAEAWPVLDAQIALRPTDQRAALRARLLAALEQR